jgi:hypothetical protein
MKETQHPLCTPSFFSCHMEAVGWRCSGSRPKAPRVSGADSARSDNYAVHLDLITYPTLIGPGCSTWTSTSVHPPRPSNLRLCNSSKHLLNHAAHEVGALSRPDIGFEVLTPAALLPEEAPTPAATTAHAENSTGPSGGGGPASRNHVIPARPKPGRKVTTQPADSVRKEQNRDSQRRFRDKTKAKMDTFVKEIEAADQRTRDSESRRLRDLAEQGELLRNSRHDCSLWQQQNEQLTQQVLQLQQQVQMLQQEAHQLQRRPSLYPQFSPHPPIRTEADLPYQHSADSLNGGYDTPDSMQGGCGGCTKDSCPCVDNLLLADDDAEDKMPGIEMQAETHAEHEMQAETHAEHEIDFTVKFASQKRTPLKPALDENESCGFCTSDLGYCLCKDKTLATPSSAPVSGPGSCPDCQANPEQRAWCQGMSRESESRQPANNHSRSFLTMEPKVFSSIANPSAKFPSLAGMQSIGCSDAFRLLEGRVFSRNESNLRNHSGRGDTPMSMEPGVYNATEVRNPAIKLSPY